METKYLLLLTNLISFSTGAFLMHIYHTKKRGKKIDIFRSALSALVVFFWSASIYKEIFLGGSPTSPALYAVFGLVQGAVFEFSVKDILTYFKK